MHRFPGNVRFPAEGVVQQSPGSRSAPWVGGCACGQSRLIRVRFAVSRNAFGVKNDLASQKADRVDIDREFDSWGTRHVGDHRLECSVQGLWGRGSHLEMVPIQVLDFRHRGR